MNPEDAALTAELQMTKVNRTVKRETLYIAAWTVILSMLMQAVFLAVGRWDTDVLFGNIASGVTSVLNFFIMGLTVSKAVEKDEKQAALLMRVSQTVRLFAIFGIIALCYFLLKFNIISLILPLFFPRIGIMFRSFFKIKEDDGREK